MSEKSLACICCRERIANFWRGCCTRCYQRMKKRVDKGEVTWKRLEEAGLCRGVRALAERGLR